MSKNMWITLVVVSFLATALNLGALSIDALFGFMGGVVWMMAMVSGTVYFASKSVEESGGE